MIIDRWYLIVRGDGSKPRIAGTRQKPRLRGDEVAFKIAVRLPEGWGAVREGEIVIDMPDPPTSPQITP